jgi:hypothetical protein
VRIDKLGAHLEAYANTLPVVTALRLCNRLGKGASCYIKKLPTELVETIEQFVLDSERERCLAFWSKELKCWKEECAMYDEHLTQQEQEIFCAQFGCTREDCNDEAHMFGGEGGEPHGHACLGRGSCGLVHSLSYEEAVISVHKKLYEQTHEAECSDNRAKFQHKIDDGVLYSYRHLLKTHFGVDFWTTTTRNPALLARVNKIALAYLTLPSYSSQQESEYDFLARNNSESRPLPPGASLSPASLKRFSEALKKLDLETFTRQGEKLSLSRIYNLNVDRQAVVEYDMELRSSRQTMSSEPFKKVGPWPQLIKMARDARTRGMHGQLE